MEDGFVNGAPMQEATLLTVWSAMQRSGHSFGPE